jgi:hypothetical protein
MKTSSLTTMGLGVLCAAHLAVLLLWVDAFDFWQTTAMFAGTMLFGLLALTKLER